MKKVLLVLLAASFFAACKSSTTSPTDVIVRHVAAGDAFSYDDYVVDSVGGVLAGSRDTSVYSVDAVDLNYAGKTGVFRVVINSSKGGDPDTNYFAYDANGDFLMALTTAVRQLPLWVRVPTAGSATCITMSSDSVVGSKGTTVERDTMTLTGIGQESMSVQGQSLTVQKISADFRLSIATSKGTTQLEQTVHFYFAPTLGIFTRVSTDEGPLSDPSESRMIGYALAK